MYNVSYISTKRLRLSRVCNLCYAVGGHTKTGNKNKASVRTYLIIMELMPLRYNTILKRYVVTDRNTVWRFSRGYLCRGSSKWQSRGHILCNFWFNNRSCELGTLCVKTACRRLCSVGTVYRSSGSRCIDNSVGTWLDANRSHRP
jgi:hypothetical protein